MCCNVQRFCKGYQKPSTAQASDTPHGPGSSLEYAACVWTAECRPPRTQMSGRHVQGWDVTLCGLLERTWREPRLMRSARLVGHTNTISGDSSAQQLPSRHCRGDTVQTRTGWRVSSDCGADVDWDMWSWSKIVTRWGRRRLNIVGLGLHPQPSAYGDACSLQCECWQLYNLAGLQPSINYQNLNFQLFKLISILCTLPTSWPLTNIFVGGEDCYAA